MALAGLPDKQVLSANYFDPTTHHQMSFFDLPPIIERMLLVSDKISDLNFSVGQLPQVEINGKLTPVQPLGLQKLTPYQTEVIAMTLLQENPEAAEKLVKTAPPILVIRCRHALDFAATSSSSAECIRSSCG